MTRPFATRRAGHRRHLGVGLESWPATTEKRCSSLSSEPSRGPAHRRPGPLVGVAPVTHRLGAAVVVTGQHQRGRPRRQLAHAVSAHRSSWCPGSRLRHTAPWSPTPAASSLTAPRTAASAPRKIAPDTNWRAASDATASTRSRRNPRRCPNPPRPSSAHHNVHRLAVRAPTPATPSPPRSPVGEQPVTKQPEAVLGQGCTDPSRTRAPHRTRPGRLLSGIPPAHEHPAYSAVSLR